MRRRPRTTAGAVLLALLSAVVASPAPASRLPNPGAGPTSTLSGVREEVKLFLLIGQSNMAGRGVIEDQDKVVHPRVFTQAKDLSWVPAIDPIHFDKPKLAGVGLGSTFGRAIADALPEATIGLIPAAFGGTSLEQWRPDGELYTNAVMRTRQAMKSGAMAGILWHQGEGDSEGDLPRAYTGRFKMMIERLRRDLDAPEVPVVVGELGRFRTIKSDINAVLAELPRHVSRCAFVSSEGLTDKGDGVHFDSRSLRELGRRYATAWQALAEGNGAAVGASRRPRAPGSRAVRRRRARRARAHGLARRPTRVSRRFRPRAPLGQCVAGGGVPSPRRGAGRVVTASIPRALAFALCLAAPLAAEAAPPRQYTIAFIGLRHHITWTYVAQIAKGQAGAVKLVGIAETEPDLIAEAQRRGAAGVPIYADYNKMLDETKPDIVWGFLENNRHLEVIQACAPRKIHVIYQKPLAATYRDALAIRALARKHGVQVLVNYDMAFYATTHAAKARADAGEIGPIWRMHGRVGHVGPNPKDQEIGRFFFRWLTDPVQNGAGALMDFGSYNAMWALWYKGRPESVFASANHLRPERFPKVEDTAVLVLSYKDGVGLFEASWNFPRSFQDLEVFGRGGSLLTTGSVEVAMRKGTEPAVKIEVPPLGPEMAGPIHYFTHCLENGKPVEGPVSLDLNVGVIEVIEAAKKSLETGKAVALPLSLP